MINLTCFETTHIGARESNQDSFASKINKDWACFVVTDGLGGHEKGEVAAKIVCRSLIKLATKFVDKINQDPIQGVSDLIYEAVAQAQDTIIKQYHLMDTQTTMALAWINDDHIITAHIGDTRIYRLSKQEILWRSPDHTPVQEMLDQGMVSEKEIAKHPLQNQLLRSVNMYEAPDADLFVHPPLDKNETLLLCTDGFWSGCEEDDFLRLSKNHGTLEKKVGDLITRILESQAEECDNITLQVVKADNTH